MPTPAATPVTEIPAAPSDVARAHFEGLLALEADCWDVHASMSTGDPGFVLLQVNGDRAGYDREHIAGATWLHHSTMNEESLASYAADTLFVVYCSGPHCNGADKAAVRLAALGRPVKKMIGGKAGWLDEGFSFVSSDDDG